MVNFGLECLQWLVYIFFFYGILHAIVSVMNWFDRRKEDKWRQEENRRKQEKWRKGEKWPQEEPDRIQDRDEALLLGPWRP
jgi:hypothetical protein